MSAQITQPRLCSFWCILCPVQATGDSAYLQDANDFYILHAYSESGGPASLAVDWSEYYYYSNVMLASLTDGPAFHQRSQYFFRQWICSYGQVSLARAHPPELLCLSVFSSRLRTGLCCSLKSRGTRGVKGMLGICPHAVECYCALP